MSPEPAEHTLRGQSGPRQRPDACPGVIALHQAADGGLARVRVPGGVLTVAQLLVLSRAAEELGDGELELTSRANLQIRALPASAAAELSQRLYDAGLLPSFTHERVRNIVASPLSGLDGLSSYDVLPVAAELDRVLCASASLAELPGRFLFTLDDGRGDLAGIPSDAGVRAVARSDVRTPDVRTGGDDVVAELILAGAGTGLSVRWPGVAGLLTEVAAAFLAERAAQRSTAWHVAELDDGAAGIRDRIRHSDGAPITTAPPPTSDSTTPAVSATNHTAADLADAAPAVGGSAARSTASLPPGRDGTDDIFQRRGSGTAAAEIGAHVQRPDENRSGGGVDERVAVVVAVPLGRLNGVQARALASLADASGGTVRVTPWRSVVVPDVVAAGNWRVLLGDAGLVVEPGSAWVGMTCCAGRPRCAKALADVRSDATRALPLLPAGRAVHWSGCERRCGRPGDAIDVVAVGNGYEVDGVTAGDVVAAVATARGA
ncbi:MAG TPA: precorrin-3B synthase [Kribbellaceae bacterium]